MHDLVKQHGSILKYMVRYDDSSIYTKLALGATAINAITSTLDTIPADAQYKPWLLKKKVSHVLLHYLELFNLRGVMPISGILTLIALYKIFRGKGSTTPYNANTFQSLLPIKRNDDVNNLNTAMSISREELGDVNLLVSELPSIYKHTWISTRLHPAVVSPPLLDGTHIVPDNSNSAKYHFNSINQPIPNQQYVDPSGYLYTYRGINKALSPLVSSTTAAASGVTSPLSNLLLQNTGTTIGGHIVSQQQKGSFLSRFASRVYKIGRYVLFGSRSQRNRGGVSYNRLFTISSITFLLAMTTRRFLWRLRNNVDDYLQTDLSALKRDIIEFRHPSKWWFSFLYFAEWATNPTVTGVEKLLPYINLQRDITPESSKVLNQITVLKDGFVPYIETLHTNADLSTTISIDYSKVGKTIESTRHITKDITANGNVNSGTFDDNNTNNNNNVPKQRSMQYVGYNQLPNEIVLPPFSPLHHTPLYKEHTEESTLLLSTKHKRLLFDVNNNNNNNKSNGNIDNRQDIIFGNSNNHNNINNDKKSDGNIDHYTGEMYTEVQKALYNALQSPRTPHSMMQYTTNAAQNRTTLFGDLNQQQYQNQNNNNDNNGLNLLSPSFAQLHNNSTINPVRYQQSVLTQPYNNPITQRDITNNQIFMTNNNNSKKLILDPKIIAQNKQLHYDIHEIEPLGPLPIRVPVVPPYYKPHLTTNANLREYNRKPRPILFVANHTILGFDMIMFQWVLHRFVNTWARGLAHAGHSNFPIWRELLMWCGSIPGTRDLTATAMDNGIPLFVFPGGGREILRHRGEDPYAIFWNQRYGFAKMAIENNAIIIPVAFVGNPEMLWHMADLPMTWFYGKHSMTQQTIELNLDEKYIVEQDMIKIRAKQLIAYEVFTPQQAQQWEEYHTTILKDLYQQNKVEQNGLLPITEVNSRILLITPTTKDNNNNNNKAVSSKDLSSQNQQENKDITTTTTTTSIVKDTKLAHHPHCEHDKDMRSIDSPYSPAPPTPMQGIDDVIKGKTIQNAISHPHINTVSKTIPTHNATLQIPQNNDVQNQPQQQQNQQQQYSTLPKIKHPLSLNDETTLPIAIPNVINPFNLQRFYFTFGDPIDCTEYFGLGDKELACRHLRDRVKTELEKTIAETREFQSRDPHRYTVNRLIDTAKYYLGFGGSSGDKK